MSIPKHLAKIRDEKFLCPKWGPDTDPLVAVESTRNKYRREGFNAGVEELQAENERLREALEDITLLVCMHSQGGSDDLSSAIGLAEIALKDPKDA